MTFFVYNRGAVGGSWQASWCSSVLEWHKPKMDLSPDHIQVKIAHSSQATTFSSSSCHVSQSKQYCLFQFLKTTHYGLTHTMNMVLLPFPCSEVGVLESTTNSINSNILASCCPLIWNRDPLSAGDQHMQWIAKCNCQNKGDIWVN